MISFAVIKGALAVTMALGLFVAISHARKAPQEAATDPEGETGTVAPNRALLATGLVIAAALAGSALLAVLLGSGGLAHIALAAASLAAAATMVAGFFGAFDVFWDEDGIEGPSVLLPRPFGPKRVKIFWENIESMGNPKGRHMHVADGTGTRVVWAVFFSGCAELSCRLAEECPWLVSAAIPREDIQTTDPTTAPPPRRLWSKFTFARTRPT